MKRHTFLCLKSPRSPKIFLLLVLSIFLLASGVSACLGGSATPGGSGLPGQEGPGGAGAPPISIPGPEALNMTNISVTSPNQQGLVTVRGGAGSANPIYQVRIRNIGVVAWYRPLQRFFEGVAYAAGEQVFVPVNPDGSFMGQIPAIPGESIEACQWNGTFCGPSLRWVIPGSGSAGPPQVIPATLPSVKQNMTIDPGSGKVYILNSGGASAKKWHWTDLFMSTAYAEERLVLPSEDKVNCPTGGGVCQVNPMVLGEGDWTLDASCRLSIQDPEKPETNKDIVISRGCLLDEGSDIKFFTWLAKNAVSYNMLAIIAHQRLLLLREDPPSSGTWGIFRVFAFPHILSKVQPITDIVSPVVVVTSNQAPYMMSLSLDDFSVMSYATSPEVFAEVQKITGFSKQGSQFVIAATQPQATVFIQGTTSEAGVGTLRRIVTVNSANPLGGFVYLGEVSRRMNIPSENASTSPVLLWFYQIAFTDPLAKRVVFVEGVGPQSRVLYRGVDFSRFETTAEISLSSAISLGRLDYDPETKVIAVTDMGASKIFYLRYSGGRLHKLEEETDFASQGRPPVNIIFNPHRGTFITVDQQGRSSTAGAVMRPARVIRDSSESEGEEQEVPRLSIPEPLRPRALSGNSPAPSRTVPLR